MTRRGFFSRCLAAAAAVFVAKPVAEALPACPPPLAFPEPFAWGSSATATLSVNDVLWFPVGGGKALVNGVCNGSATVTWVEPRDAAPAAGDACFRLGNARSVS